MDRPSVAKMTNFIIIHVPGRVCVVSEVADEACPRPNVLERRGQDNVDVLVEVE